MRQTRFSRWSRLFLALGVIAMAPFGRGSAKDRGIDVQVGPGLAVEDLQAARDLIRAKRASGAWLGVPITVRIEGGQYVLEEPLVFGPEDSGSPEAPVVYAAQPGARVVISGGRQIAGWRAGEANGHAAWTVELPEVRTGVWTFRQLFVDDERRPRTRLPRKGFFTFTGLPSVTPETRWSEGQTAASFAPGNLSAGWRNLSDVDVVALHFWIESRLPVASVDPESNVVTFAHASTFRLTEAHGLQPCARYYVENVYEALHEPGEWYLDRPTGVLSYVPRAGETPENTRIIAPRLPCLVELRGESAPDRRVTDLRFEGFSFAHTEWSWPEGDAGSVQAAWEAPGAVVLENAERCEFRNCSVGRVAGYGIEIGAGCADTRIENCVVTDLGAGGVKIGHDSERTIVRNCEIGDGGRIFPSGVGIWIGHSPGNRITHNEIHHLYYTGVSVGWSWGYAESKAVDNAVEHNHIHHIGQGWLSDMAGIYTLGVSPGTVLRHNRIHDVEAHAYGGWGLYNDEGSTGIVLEHNLVYRTTHGGYHQHYGRENVIRDNIFAFGRHAQIMRTREEEHVSFVFERNVVLFDEGVLLGSNWSNDRFVMNRNLYWRLGSEPFDFAGADLETWRARGHDVGSIVTDPMFMDAENGDFRLVAGSPAVKLGFDPVCAHKAGRLPAEKPPRRFRWPWQRRPR